MSDHAVIVGINQYARPNGLRGCVADALAWRAFLLARGWSGDTIKMLLDHDATAAPIRRALEQMVGGAAPEDRLMFCFSGHGAQLVEGQAATDCICPIDFDWTAERALDVGDFVALLGQIPRDVAAVAVFDSCHSGGIGGDSSKALRVLHRRIPRTMNPDREVPAVRTFAGTQLPRVGVVTACRSEQTADDTVIGGRPCGAFSHYLLRELEAPRAGEIALAGLIGLAGKALHGAGYAQEPQTSGPAEILAVPFLAEVCT